MKIIHSQPALQLQRTIYIKTFYWCSLNALALYTRNCEKCSYLPYTLTPQHFSQLQWFLQQFFYKGNDFHNVFFRKIFAILCVICEGLLSNFDMNME